jgi:mannose-6-phosphate isomerase-like protein (cupin superfamily)
MPESKPDLGVVHVPPGGSKSVWFNGGLVTFYALGEDTGGAVTLFEEALAPQDRAMPHLHHEEDQAFYVLKGEHEFFCDGRTFTAGAGSFVYVPRGTTHSYENVGTEPGRLLILSTPAGGTERLFFDLGEPAAEGSPPPPIEPLDLQSFRATVQSYGSDIDLFALLQQISAERSDEQDALGPPM